MNEDDVKRFLQYPSSALVDFALSMVNLTWQENMVITLCGRQGYTHERAAEKAACSGDTMQRWYRAAIKKLCAAWAGSPWIKKVIE